MKRFIQGSDRTQGILLPERLDDDVTDSELAIERDAPFTIVDIAH